MTENVPMEPSFDAATAELCKALENGLTEHFGRRLRIVHCERRPSAFQSSHPIHELDVRLDDGLELAVIVKPFAQHGPTEGARSVKPDFILDPLREIETYRRLLADHATGAPACYGSVADPERGRYWLFLERVRGTRLWELGDLGFWQSVARWLASFHACARHLTVPTGGPGAPLIHDAAFHRVWADRAWRFVGEARRVERQRLRRFAQLIERYDTVIDRLEGLPRTLLHGEFFPSNVLVVRSGNGTEATPRRVCPLDWELTGIGPGISDLATLTAGWVPEKREAIALAYFEEQRSTAWFGSSGKLLEALDVCQLQLAIQMLGWAEGWTPPRGHRQDWLGVALAAAARLKITDEPRD